MIAAKQFSDKFDDAFGFACSASKCHIACHLSLEAGEAVHQALGYSLGCQLEVLGLSYDLSQDGLPRLSRFNLDKALTRLRFIRAVAGAFFHKNLHIRRFVLPLFTWAAGLCVVPAGFLKLMQDGVRHVFDARYMAEAPNSILQEVAGWDTDPVFADDWATLMAGIRLHCSSSSWHELLDVEFAVQPWHRLLPRVSPLLARLGWWVGHNAACIYRQDASGHQRRFELGWDQPAVLHEWLCDSHRCAALKKCNRVCRSLHRGCPGAQVAAGLDPPSGLYPGAMCVFAGHRSALPRITKRTQAPEVSPQERDRGTVMFQDFKSRSAITDQEDINRIRPRNRQRDQGTQHHPKSRHLSSKRALVFGPKRARDAFVCARNHNTPSCHTTSEGTAICSNWDRRTIHKGLNDSISDGRHPTWIFLKNRWRRSLCHNLGQQSLFNAIGWRIHQRTKRLHCSTRPHKMGSAGLP